MRGLWCNQFHGGPAKDRTKEAHMKAVVSPTEGNDNCAIQSQFLLQFVFGNEKKRKKHFRVFIWKHL